MQRLSHNLTVKIATTTDELKAAQRLRYRVFVEELGAGGDMVDHVAKLEIDRFDAYCDHLILTDATKNAHNLEHVVGVYRLLRGEHARKAGQFYSEDEYDLEVLKQSGRRILELGRSCVHPAYRGGFAMYHLWQGLADYIDKNKIEILFGVASFHGTEVRELAHPLSLLHDKYLAPQALRVRAKPAHFQALNVLLPESIDRVRAMVQMPTLIKSYLKLGGFVGEGAFVDHAFNTTDICMILDTAKMAEHQKKTYRKEAIE